MNYNFLTLIVVLFLAISFANGQEFFQFTEEITFDSAIYSDGLSNGNLLLLTKHTKGYYSLGGGPTPKYQHFLDEFSDSTYTFNKLYLLDHNLSIERELNFQSNTDSINWVLNFQIDEPDDVVVVFVANLKADTTQFYMHWYNLDLQLQHTLPIPGDFRPFTHLFFGWHFIINRYNSIIYPGTNGFYEFTKYGKERNTFIPTFDVIPVPPSPFLVENSLGEYFSVEPQLLYFTTFNNDLSIKEFVDYYNLQNPRIDILTDCKRLAISTNKDNAYVSGFVKIEEPCDTGRIGRFRYGEFVYKYNLIEPGVPELFYIDSTEHCEYKRYGQFAIDLFHDDYIYYSHSDKDCGFIAPPGADPTCYETYITLKCLDDEGNLRWSKYLGGDAAYLPQGVVATPDSGVVVFVLRHHPDENLRYAADIYAAKFDKNGNAIELSNAGLVSTNAIELNRQIKVYPNPVHKYLIAEGLQPSYQNTIKLYNSAGQLTAHKKVNSNKIDLSQLPKGYYAYALFEHGLLLKAGKLIKQ